MGAQLLPSTFGIFGRLISALALPPSPMAQNFSAARRAVASRRQKLALRERFRIATRPTPPLPNPATRTTLANPWVARSHATIQIPRGVTRADSTLRTYCLNSRVCREIPALRRLPACGSPTAGSRELAPVILECRTLLVQARGCPGF